MNSRRLILYTLAFINFTHIVDSMLIMPLGDIFIKTFEINAQQYSFLVSSYAIAAFISSLIGILYIDRFDRKKALLFVYTGFAIGTFLCAFANSYVYLISLRFLTGFFGGLIGALVLSIVSDLYPFKERGTAMGILMTAFSAASALGVPIGIFLAANGKWQLPFGILGGLGILISGFVLFSFPPMTKHLKHLHKDRNYLSILTQIALDKNQTNALLAGFVLVFGHFLIIPFISPYMIKNVGLTQIEISYQFFLGGIFTIISSPMIGRLSDRQGILPIFTTMMALSFIPTVLITHMQGSSLVFALTITTMFFIFASGRMIPPQTIITAAASPSNRGSFMSLKSALQQLAIALASIISGSIVVINHTGTFSNYNWVGYLAILVGIITYFLIRRLKVAKGN